MLWISRQKVKKLSARLDLYMNVATETLSLFQEFIECVVNSGTDARSEVLALQIAEIRHDCSDMRLRLERAVFTKSLPPAIRGDLLAIVKMLDSIPEHCQSAANAILDQRLVFLPENKEDYIKGAKLVVENFELTSLAVKDAFGKAKCAMELGERIDDMNHRAVEIKRRIIRRIFSSDSPAMHLGGCLEHKEIASRILDISNLCKHLAERIIIASIKLRA